MSGIQLDCRRLRDLEPIATETKGVHDIGARAFIG
jgi:hypothetical protein